MVRDPGTLVAKGRCIHGEREGRRDREREVRGNGVNEGWRERKGESQVEGGNKIRKESERE